MGTMAPEASVSYDAVADSVEPVSTIHISKMVLSIARFGGPYGNPTTSMRRTGSATL